MTSHSSATVTRGKRRYEFVPGFVYESDDSTNPLHGSLVGATSDSVVVTDGRRMIHALRSEVTTVA